MISMRLGSVRPFIGTRSYDDGTATTLQAGLTTYGTNADGEQTYQTSYLEWGGRLDHLSDAIDLAQGNDVPERLVATAIERDRRYVADNERNGITGAADATVDVATA